MIKIVEKEVDIRVYSVEEMDKMFYEENVIIAHLNYNGEPKHTSKELPFNYDGDIKYKYINILCRISNNVFTWVCCNKPYLNPDYKLYNSAKDAILSRLNSISNLPQYIYILTEEELGDLLKITE